MSHEVRRYVYKIKQDAVEIRTQGQAARGAYFTVGNTTIDIKGLSKQERLAKIEAAIKQLNPRAVKQG